jgi:hypothetical protein
MTVPPSYTRKTRGHAIPIHHFGEDLEVAIQISTPIAANRNRHEDFGMLMRGTCSGPEK